MVKFTSEMKEALKVPGKGGGLIYLATSTLDFKWLKLTPIGECSQDKEHWSLGPLISTS